MRRPSLKNLPPGWRKAIILAAVFALGTLFDRHVIPLLARDVGVWTIKGEKGRGCEGSWGATLLRFGRHYGHVDGAYKFPCGEFTFASDTAALYCDCPP